MSNDLLLALLHRLQMNQVVLGLAIEEVATWIEQRDSTDTSEAVRRHLNSVQANADLIGEGIVTLMADS